MTKRKRTLSGPVAAYSVPSSSAHEFTKLCQHEGPVSNAGYQVGYIHQGSMTPVNTQCHTDWTKNDAWINIGHIKSTYNHATWLSKSIGNGDSDKNKLHDPSRIPAHAKCGDNNDNGVESSSNDTDSEDDNENGKPTESLVSFNLHLPDRS
ncbi:MAG: hypothetical protein J3Q66DRAFT_403658 [Benniella sp.]|nr:MAG: hypothetical protein J3Q66DRAFT_403658 [Benniella sp.]